MYTNQKMTEGTGRPKVQYESQAKNCPGFFPYTDSTQISDLKALDKYFLSFKPIHPQHSAFDVMCMLNVVVGLQDLVKSKTLHT